MRLVDGRNPNEGRVEVYYNGEWGTVCDDLWDENDAKVVCRQLGLPTANATAYSEAHFESGIGPILIDGVECIGIETSLDICQFLGWKSHNCGHEENAGVKCESSDQGKLTN